MSIKARVQNFQSIADATVEIEGLTAITGANNSGKSALMRAIRAACQNARGSAFIRNGKEKAVVEIDFGDGHSLRWEKGRSKSSKPTYVVDGGDPLYPGQGVPPEVEVLGIKPIHTGGKDIWPQFAPQIEGQLFLINEPGSVLAEAVADVDRVGQLNQALREAESDRRAASAELKVRMVDKDDQQRDLEKFKGLDAQVLEMEAIEKGVVQVVRLEKALTGVQELKGRWEKAEATVTHLSGIGKASVPDGQEVEKMLAEVEALIDLRDRLTLTREQVAKYAKIKNVAVDLGSEQVEKTRLALDIVGGQKQRWEDTAQKIKDAEAEGLTARDELAALEVEVTTMLAEMGQCPVCGSKVKHGAHK